MSDADKKAAVEREEAKQRAAEEASKADPIT